MRIGHEDVSLLPGMLVESVSKCKRALTHASCLRHGHALTKTRLNSSLLTSFRALDHLRKKR